MKINNLKEFKAFSKDLTKRIKKEKIQVLGLVGDLGSGKTTLVKEILKELGVKRTVTSPTFLLIKLYRDYIYHIDCYRLENPKELLFLGLNELLRDKDNFLLIEWADKVRKFLPKDTLWVNIEYTDDKKGRIIELS